MQFLCLVLMAVPHTLPVCLGFDDSLADIVIDKLQKSIEQIHGQRSSTLLAAIYLQSECSDDLLECQTPGAFANAADLRCFSICIAVNIGCRSCCLDSKCYQPPDSDRDLGSCGQCADDADVGQCALPVVTVTTECLSKASGGAALSRVAR
jgi:hypothetical protein